MTTPQVTSWHHSNKYAAASACEHCSGVLRHEPWCVTRSPMVLYAYAAVLDAENLSEGDKLILHAVGAAWTGKVCGGACNASRRD